MTSHVRRTLLLAVLALLARPAPGSTQDLQVRVNLPAYRLDVYRGEEKLATYPIAIGLRNHETPLGAYDVTYIEWNPWWNPPNSPWARGEKRTPPGPRNPMGRAKIEFLPLFYIHGSREALGRPASHGCIRMANDDVLALARLIAQEGGARIEASEIDALERNSGRTRRVALERPVRVHIVYRLTERIDGKVNVYEDVYRMGMTSRELEMAGLAQRPPY